MCSAYGVFVGKATTMKFGLASDPVCLLGRFVYTHIMEHLNLVSMNEG